MEEQQRNTTLQRVRYGPTPNKVFKISYACHGMCAIYPHKYSISPWYSLKNVSYVECALSLISWKDSLEVSGIFMLLSGPSSRNWLTHYQNEGYSGKLTGKNLMRNIFDRCFSHALCALCCRILNLSFDM